MQPSIHQPDIIAGDTDGIAKTHMASDNVIANKLACAVAEFIARLERGLLNGEVAEQLARVLRAEQHLLACADQALVIARAQAELEIMADEKRVLKEWLSARSQVTISLSPGTGEIAYLQALLARFLIRAALDSVTGR